MNAELQIEMERRDRLRWRISDLKKQLEITESDLKSCENEIESIRAAKSQPDLFIDGRPCNRNDS
jgi:chromosome segregation ATPase